MYLYTMCFLEAYICTTIAAIVVGGLVFVLKKIGQI